MDECPYPGNLTLLKSFDMPNLLIKIQLCIVLWCQIQPMDVDLGGVVPLSFHGDMAPPQISPRKTDSIPQLSARQQGTSQASLPSKQGSTESTLVSLLSQPPSKDEKLSRRPSGSEQEMSSIKVNITNVNWLFFIIFYCSIPFRNVLSRVQCLSNITCKPGEIESLVSLLCKSPTSEFGDKPTHFYLELPDCQIMQ